MKKLIISNNGDIKIKVGLAKKEFSPDNLQITSSRVQKGADLGLFTLNKNEILEGIIQSASNDKYTYKCQAKKVRVPRLDVTIRADVNIGVDSSAVRTLHYDFWYPTTYWICDYSNRYPNFYLLVREGDRLPLPMLNLWANSSSHSSFDKTYPVCTGQALAGISMSSKEETLANLGEIFNTLICGKMNLDLNWQDSVGMANESRNPSYIHKLFLQISFIHSHIINSAEEADKWWEKHYTNPQDFFEKLTSEYSLYDSKLLEDFGL